MLWVVLVLLKCGEQDGHRVWGKGRRGKSPPGMGFSAWKKTHRRVSWAPEICICMCVQVCGWLLGVFRIYVRLCVGACVRVWAGSCQDRAAIVPRPVLPLGAYPP